MASNAMERPVTCKLTGHEHVVVFTGIHAVIGRTSERIGKGTDGTCVGIARCMCGAISSFLSCLIRAKAIL